MTAREFSRPRRVAGQIRRELADILVREARDPRFARITISTVEVSRDLSNAKIFFVSPEDVDPDDLQKALRRATGYLRRNLAERLSVRSMPSIRFVHDRSTENALRLSALIERVLEDSEERAAGDD